MNWPISQNSLWKNFKTLPIIQFSTDFRFSKCFGNLWPWGKLYIHTLNLYLCDHFKHKILKIRQKLQKLCGFELGRKCQFWSLAPRHGAKYEFCTEIWMDPSSGALVDSKKHSGCPELKRQVVSVPCEIDFGRDFRAFLINYPAQNVEFRIA